MATSLKKSQKSATTKTKRRYIGKPGGVIQERVQKAGPERFGIIAVDCAKKRSKWFLCDYYGRVIIEPTTVEHNSGCLKAMTQQIQDTYAAEGIVDSIAAVEMTGVYHRPVQRALRKAGFDTRTVHPFASSHYRKTLHPDIKTDDNDLEAIFHAAINGYGLALLDVDPVYLLLQGHARHRRNLVKQRARLNLLRRRRAFPWWWKFASPGIVASRERSGSTKKPSRISTNRLSRRLVSMTNESEGGPSIDLTASSRCGRCRRPRSLCFCASIPSINNRTSVLILQHRRERTHPFNTARIVDQALQRCQLISGHNSDLARRFDSMPLGKNVGLLFPGDDSRLFSELEPGERPEQLIIPDGTWHNVKTLMRDVPRLRTLPRYRLAPSTPGRYRIRREPNAQALSTLEATVAALSAIEPETAGLDQLLEAFERMIADQISHSKSNWRENQSRRKNSPNIPRILTGDLSNIVVAYGEREQGNRGSEIRGGKPLPVYWTAVRLVSGEVFRSAIESDSLDDVDFLKMLRLEPSEAKAAVSACQFRNDWKAFLEDDDYLAIRHPSTARLLDNIDAQFSPTVILKSINVQPPLDAVELKNNLFRFGHSRASERLASAVGFIEYLNSNDATPLEKRQ